MPRERFAGFCLLMILAWAVLPLGTAAGELALPDPEAPGAYPVGVTTMLLVDPAREDPASGGARSLPTEIWYPAADETRDLPKNELVDFFQGKAPLLTPVLKAAFGADLLAANKIFQNFAVRDARPRDGKFPLVVFSHGNGGLRMQNAFWAEHLASHGYIVVAPDHTGNCAVTFLKGRLIPFEDTDEGRERAAELRPQDVSFIIDAMAHMHKGGDSRFTGRIDLDHVAVSGHSFGGYTSTWVADADPRVDVIIPMAGVAKDRQGCKIPALILFAAEDDTLGNEGVARIRQYYAACQGPRYSVEFVNAGHFSFTEMFQLKPDFGDGCGEGTRISNGEPITYVPMDVVFPLTNGYSTAFLGKYLKGDDRYEAYLGKNHNADELITHCVP